MRRALLLLMVLMGCGPESKASGRFTLTYKRPIAEGLVLATSRRVQVDVTKVPADPPDIRVSDRQLPGLKGGRADGSFCAKGWFANVADIPADPTGCDFKAIAVGCFSNSPDSTCAQAGFLVRDTTGDLYRLLLVTGTSDLFDRFSTFDLSPL